MSKDEIKDALSGYRPEIYDADDPQIAEALKQAKADPELWQELELEFEFDRNFSESIRAVPVDRLKMEQLLETAENERIKKCKTRKIRPMILMAAAVLLISGVLVNYFLFPPPVEFPKLTESKVKDFRDHMAYFATQRFLLEATSSDMEVSRKWLADRKAPVYKVTPELLAKLEGMGCRQIDWNGTKVSLICFENGDNDLVHLFIVETANLTDANMARLGLLEKHHNLETQGWKDGRFVYMLVGSDPDVSLKGLL